MQITWEGTASFLVEAEGERILFDPFVELIGGANPNTLDDFMDEKVIFITHGHFDHIFYVPVLLEDGDPTVFCTKLAAKTIAKNTDFNDSVAVLAPGMEIPVGKVRVKVYRGSHIQFDRRYARRTITAGRLLRHARNLPFLLWANRSFQEGGESVAYELKAEGKNILILGSLAIDETETYPESPDLLILPYQGNNDLLAAADQIISRIRPKRILLSHFDDAFPPLSINVDTHPLKKMMDEKYPEIPVVKPAAGKPVRF